MCREFRKDARLRVRRLTHSVPKRRPEHRTDTTCPAADHPAGRFSEGSGAWSSSRLQFVSQRTDETQEPLIALSRTVPSTESVARDDSLATHKTPPAAGSSTTTTSHLYPDATSHPAPRGVFCFYAVFRGVRSRGGSRILRLSPSGFQPRLCCSQKSTPVQSAQQIVLLFSPTGEERTTGPLECGSSARAGGVSSPFARRWVS